jgi:predicted AAA+ superfamily ATPase
MKKYYPRLIEQEIKATLSYVGGVLITGPKACGKTETARQFAKSSVNLESDRNAQMIAEADPRDVLSGEPPRLIDEYQVVPAVWNTARHEIDNRQKTGQFIFTGSSTPRDETALHSGIGRIARLKMRPMTWVERGYSSGNISLGYLLAKHEKIQSELVDEKLGVIAERICVGGWPLNISLSVRAALLANRQYVDLLAESDISKPDGKYRDPIRVRKFIESYSRNVATPAKISTLVSDTGGLDDEAFTRITAREYQNQLTQLMVIEDLPVWPTHIRSSAKLRQTPKRHFVDPSLAVASLALSPEMIMKDLNYFGFLFESLVLMNIRVYAELNDALVYYYRDTDDDEIDIIVEKRSGEWAIFEVKLSANQAEDGVMQIKRFIAKLSDEKLEKLTSKNIVVGLGGSYTRPDGVNIISLASLGI